MKKKLINKFQVLKPILAPGEKITSGGDIRDLIGLPEFIAKEIAIATQKAIAKERKKKSKPNDDELIKVITNFSDGSKEGLNITTMMKRKDFDEQVAKFNFEKDYRKLIKQRLAKNLPILMGEQNAR